MTKDYSVHGVTVSIPLTTQGNYLADFKRSQSGAAIFNLSSWDKGAHYVHVHVGSACAQDETFKILKKQALPVNKFFTRF